MSETRSQPVLTVQIGGEWYGVPLESVKEITEERHVQPVPRAPAPFRGLADVRGRMTTVIDLGRLVAGHHEESADGRLMILAEPRDHLALWTASEVSLCEVAVGTLRARPGGDAGPDVFEGYALSGDTLINILSTEKVLLGCEAEILRRYRISVG